MSDIVAIHLINPSTYSYVEISNAATPISFTVPLSSNARPNDGYVYMVSYMSVCENLYDLMYVLLFAVAAWNADIILIIHSTITSFNNTDMLYPSTLKSQWLQVYKISDPNVYY